MRRATAGRRPASRRNPKRLYISNSATQGGEAGGDSRAIDPEVVAPPQLQAEELERVEPRAPLSELALAGPPKPPKTKMPDDWNGTKLFQPVASAAGVIEAKGYSVAISGVDIVRQDETCTDGGKSWTCGTRARTAFRAFLRGRAVVCTVPPEGGRDLITAECRVGNQDVGQWLIENGWARAAKSGPYVEAGEKARMARKGIFGPAPKSLRPASGASPFCGHSAADAADSRSVGGGYAANRYDGYAAN